MARSRGGGRYTPPSDPTGPDPWDDALPSLRQRSPITFWTAVFLAAVLVLSTVATALSIALA